MVSEAKREEMLYRVAFEGANLLKVSLVLAALALSVVVLGATIPPAQAAFPGNNGKIAFTHAFSRGANEVSDIYTVNPDGTSLTNLTASISNTSYELMPAWSPDGTKIAFMSNLHEDATRYEFYVIDASGRNLKRLTRTPGTNSEPDWQPLPKPMKSTPEKQQEVRQQNQQQQHAQHGSKSRSVTVRPPDTGGYPSYW